MRSARLNAKLSKAELGRRINLSAVSIWRIEERTQIPDANTMARWAEACGVAIASLYDNDGHEAAA